MADSVAIPLDTPNMLAEVEGSIGWMTFNKPARRNAVSLDMWEAMPRILERFEADPAVRTIVLRGAGDAAFVSGADISQFEKARANPEMNAEYDAALDRATEALEACTKPTIAMIRGWCIGGGMAIAVCCDMRIATEGSKFGVPAARLGLGYGAVGVRRLMNIVGPSFTKEIFLTARHFSAAEALAMLAREDVPDEVHRSSVGRELHFGPEYILPKPMDPRLRDRVAAAVADAAVRSGVARLPYPAHYPKI